MAEDPRTTQLVVHALVENRLAADPVGAVVQIMLNGLGYKFDDLANVSRDNDQLIRARASELLAEASRTLHTLEAGFREAHVGPSTREQPFPPAQATAALRSLDALRRRVGDLSTTVLTLETPATDRVWARLRGERDLLERLLATDIGIVAQAQDLLAACQSLDVTLVHEKKLTATDIPLATLESVLRERRALLSIL